MTVVADTNVIAYYLLESPEHFDEVREFWLGPWRVQAPLHWQAELANLIWFNCRQRAFDATVAHQKLALALRLKIVSRSLLPLWEGAISRSLATGIAVYDTLFVELAALEGGRLATFDKAVLCAFPDLAVRPRELAA